MMAAKRLYNPLNKTLLILLCCTLFINVAEATTATLTESTAYASQRPCAKSCFYWGSSTKGGADFLADRIGCGVDPIEDECICRSDLQQTADSFLRKCVNDNCDANVIDISSAVSIYGDYCTSNGYTRATSTAQTTRTTSSDSPSVWGPTSAAGVPWAAVRMRLTNVDALDSTSQASAATSTNENSSDRTTESKQSLPSATQTTRTPTTSSNTEEGARTGQNDGSKLKVGEIVGIVVGILGFIATAVGSWFSYKTLIQRKRLAANPP
ncbi:hypothetical protein CNMCM5793_009656 [Aspergillus hiratsukae]|uniref:Extracellular membrane protein CFEM domain-containing protein n=1 Tax=Aspergillus hiratsukae TaxID=1194566 RepID=A0A8H6P1Q8_9EURO|nr:hypothetical protein CNMCM5793_009656 [Aspergillus hiratsukae]KAF7156198.1 hypothetical protein CNMCM6106_009263 [Aspergillus hiratsukae]